MVAASPPPLHLPVFAGQGTTAAAAPQTRQRAILDASSRSGSILLSACHEAFHRELSSLSAPETLHVAVDIADFSKPEDLLSWPEGRYLQNPVISGSTLFLLQTLRYLSFIEETGISSDSLTPFSDVLKKNSEHGLGVLGFSSGILPACVVATSTSTFSYISTAVEAYRLALWVGIRSQLYRRDTLKCGSLNLDTKLPWSLVFIGMSRMEAEVAISSFSKGLETPSVYITAIIDDTCVTVSGRPDVLSAFSAFVTAERDSVVHATSVDTLYHSPIHVNTTRERLLADVTSRSIKLPQFCDIKVPIRSTFTGHAITKDEPSGSLLESVVDMLLTQPVNWNLVVEDVIRSSPDSTPIRLLNVGPGAGLARGIERVFPPGYLSVIDLANTTRQERKAKQEPIAIIGMAVNMPGAPNVSKLWEILEHGINTISEIPEHRFKVSDYNEGQNPKRTMKAHTGNFIDAVDDFDNKFFKISPREARSMDPQQRILLHTAYEALEDSGYVPNATPTTNPETFGCYIGVATHDYIQNLRDNIDVYYSPGTLKAFLSGRISYAMQLSGPSIVVDTACSSSNVALYQGARALMNGDCDSALVGGVNIVSSPDMFLGLDRAHFLSPTGQCKAFDASADGYSRSEGCGVFVLKRLSDALAENDRILGVIRGIEVNQSGLAHSITHPHAPTQAALFRRVLENSNVDPSRVNVVEAHGTGTQAGDPNELESIRSVFSVQRSAENPLHITSIKANIGHLEAASGAAGLAKLLLMLQHKRIPRQISLKHLNPRIAPLDSDNTIIDTVNVHWPPSHAGMTRLALLNNFGAAGSNTALLLEEHAASRVREVADQMSYVFGLSAKDDATLEILRSKFLHYLESVEEPLSDIAYTSTARRQIYDHRLAISANTVEDLIGKLRRALAVQTSSKDARVVFVFSGQGGQYLGMGNALYRTSPLFRRYIDDCHGILVSGGFPGVLAIITADGQTSGLSTSDEFQAYQASIFALQYALAKLWMSWGLSPTAVVGHSLGEYAALVIANVVSLKDALFIVAHRVRLMVQSCALRTTGMMAVNLGSASVHEALHASPEFSVLSIACFNSPIDCVVAGPLACLKTFKAYLDAQIGCKNIILAVPFGYHSLAMAPLLDDLTAVARGASLNAPTIPIVSNVLGRVVSPGDSSVFNATYFARHCVEPVQFYRGVQALAAHSSKIPIDAWIEIGPHPTTLPMLKSNGSLPRDSILLGSLRRQQDPWTTLTTGLSQLYSAGVNVRWRATFAHVNSVRCISLPSYPFSPKKFWVDYLEPQPVGDGSTSEVSLVAPMATGYPMLDSWKQRPNEENGFIAMFTTPIRSLARWISGHTVGGTSLCPASVYIEQALSGIHLACHHLGIALQDTHTILRQLVFTKPLVYEESVGRVVVVSITIQERSGMFSISSLSGSSQEETIHAHGEYRLQSTLQTVTKFTRTLPTISRYMAAVVRPSTGQPPEVFSTRTAYEVIFPRVVDYSKQYHTMRSITVDASSMEGCADVCLPTDHDRGKFVVHPVFMDTLLHVAGFVANLQGGPNDAFICSEVGAVKVIPHLVSNDAAYTVYCSNAWVPEDGMVLADTYAVLCAEPRRIVAHMKGMQFRRVPLDRFKRGLSLAAGKGLSRPSELQPSISIKPQQSHLSFSSSTSTSVSPNLHGTIVDIISQTCDLKPQDVDVNTDLASLGVDSLMSIEIFGRLGHAFPDASLNAHTLSFCTTVADIIREVSTKINSRTSAGNYSPTTTFSGTSTPRTLVTEDTLSEPPHLLAGEPDVKRILASVLDVGIRDVEDDVEFENLGLDSLTSIEALHALKAECSLDLPNNFFTKFHTPRAAQSYLTSRLSKPSEPVRPCAIDKKATSTDITSLLRLDTVPLPIQSSNPGRLPLFLIHDGSGLVNYLERLSQMGRPVWGVHNPKFPTARAWDSVGQMAKSYADLISGVATGPVLLGGWSFGGVAAYEVAGHLERQGIRVQGILLIDSPSPTNHVPLSDSLIDSILSLDGRGSSSELGRLVKAQFSMNSRLLGKYKPEYVSGRCPPLVLLRSREGFSPAGVDVPSWLSNRSDPRLISAGWESLSGSQVQAVSLQMIEGCDYLERL
ncbi:Type I Iterative PKS [Asterophora parasitica]|uniref:Type I Iterative PKS n=1 Tax=Asterophora parasitica TaxID=117018 RepID=A0A9P7G5N6_9AGAR|nr:Type I Iterative PKS [Asterophora parasitica]